MKIGRFRKLRWWLASRIIDKRDLKVLLDALLHAQCALAVEILRRKGVEEEMEKRGTEFVQ